MVRYPENMLNKYTQLNHGFLKKYGIVGLLLEFTLPLVILINSSTIPFMQISS